MIYEKGHPQFNTGKTYFKKGKPSWNKGLKGYNATIVRKKDWGNKISLSLKGKPKSEEHKRRLKIARQRIPIRNWRGGSSFEPYSVDWTRTFKKSIRERDHYICQICLGEGNQVHHIDYNKQNCNLNNLVTLCLRCHMKTNGNRNYWIKYFTYGKI